jgi:aryl-alcohol dehydrogenase-like predicted oxidoreductase
VQVEENVGAADLPPIPDQLMTDIRKIYDREVRPHVHFNW